MKVIKGELIDFEYTDVLDTCGREINFSIGVAVGVAYEQLQAAMLLHLEGLDPTVPGVMIDGVIEAAPQLQTLADKLGFAFLAMPNYYGAKEPGKCKPGKEGIGRYCFTLKVKKPALTVIDH